MTTLHKRATREVNELLRNTHKMCRCSRLDNACEQPDDGLPTWVVVGTIAAFALGALAISYYVQRW